MAKFTLRLVGEDSTRNFETSAENETVESLAQHLTKTGFMLGKMRTTERIPEPQDVAIFLSQVKWIASPHGR
jgi:hypothetical protein